MASDSPARSLDEIDLSALRVSRTCFFLSFQWSRAERGNVPCLSVLIPGQPRGSRLSPYPYSRGWAPLVLLGCSRGSARKLVELVSFIFDRCKSIT